jgi:hypothetical protein
MIFYYITACAGIQQFPAFIRQKNGAPLFAARSKVYLAGLDCV